MGGGGFMMEPDNPLLDDFALGLTDAELPTVCMLATASGDSDEVLDRFYAAFPASRAKATHLSLFRRQRGDLRERLLANDLIYIGGGNTANMLALWNLHSMDDLVREAYEAGVVIAGMSAGACCLFEATLTDSFGPPLRAMRDGLGIIAGSFCPHYEQRRPRFRECVGSSLPEGFAAADGAALHFVDGVLVEAVSSRPEAGAWRVGVNDERPVPVRFLGAS